MCYAAVDALTPGAGIRENAACPGSNDPPIIRNAIKMNPAHAQWIQDLTPLERAAFIIHLLR